MDDVLFAHYDKIKLKQLVTKAESVLGEYGLIIAKEKIQEQPPFEYLGNKLDQTRVWPQKVQLWRDCLHTLNDFQKLLGDINWLRPSLRIPTYALQSLFLTLQGDPALDSPRSLSTLAEKELSQIEQICRLLI